MGEETHGTPAPNFFFFPLFFNDTAPTEIYPLSLHDALPIYAALEAAGVIDVDDHRLADHPGLGRPNRCAADRHVGDGAWELAAIGQHQAPLRPDVAALVSAPFDDFVAAVREFAKRHGEFPRMLSRDQHFGPSDENPVSGRRRVLVNFGKRWRDGPGDRRGCPARARRPGCGPA